MDWDEYVDTGMLYADETAHICSHGTIKPTYMIESEDDGDYILHTVGAGEDQRLHTTREVYETLETTEVPVPGVVHDGTDRNAPFLIVDAVEGTNPERTYEDLDPEEVLAFARQAGKSLGYAHTSLETTESGTIEGGSGGIEVNPRPWDDLLIGHMEEKTKYLEETDLEEGLLEETKDVLAAIEEELPHDPDPSLLHLDYRPGNLMWDGEGITAVLDWDNARSGDPVYDYVNAKTSFVENAPEELRDDVDEAFRTGYEETGRETGDECLQEMYRYLSLLSKAKGMIYVNEEYEAGLEQREKRYTDLFIDAQRSLLGSIEG